jgi:hypothetical protein
MEEIGFIVLELKPLLFICQKGNKFVIIWLHVDDRFVMASSRVARGNGKGNGGEMDGNGRKDCRDQYQRGKWNCGNASALTG